MPDACMLQRNVPEETMLIYRTGAPGSWGQCPNKDGSPIRNAYGELIHRNHIEQLNAAARDALQDHPRWHLMDLEALTAGFDCPQDYLRDHVHVDEHVTWNILNIYMNMLWGAWEHYGEPAWRAQD